MNEQKSSALSYITNSVIGFFGAVSTDVYMVVIALVGMVITAYINNYWQKKRFEADYGKDK